MRATDSVQRLGRHGGRDCVPHTDVRLGAGSSACAGPIARSAQLRRAPRMCCSTDSRVMSRPGRRVSIARYCSSNPTGRLLRPGAAPTLPDAYAHAIDPIPIGIGEGCCGTAAARHQMVIIKDVQQYRPFDPICADRVVARPARVLVGADL